MTDKEKALAKLGLSEEEIAEVVETDRRIDKGEKLFDLPEELQKGAKKARMSGNTKGYTREKKVDEDKKFLMEIITDEISNHADHFTVVNAERELTFTYKDKKYKVVLSCPRS